MRKLFFIKDGQTYWYAGGYSIEEVIKNQFPGMHTELIVRALDKWLLTIRETGKQYSIVLHSK